MIIKADDNKFYDNPIIGVARQWYLDFDDRKDDSLVIVARPREKGEDRTYAVPIINPRDIQSILGLPDGSIIYPVKNQTDLRTIWPSATPFPIGWVVNDGTLNDGRQERMAKYKITWPLRMLVPSALIMRHEGISDACPPNHEVYFLCSSSDLADARRRR